MEKLQEFLEGDLQELNIPMQPIDKIEAELNKFGWEMEFSEMDTNGWEHDFWVPFYKDGQAITLGGSWYYGGYNLSKD